MKRVIVVVELKYKLQYFLYLQTRVFLVGTNIHVICQAFRLIGSTFV